MSTADSTPRRCGVAGCERKHQAKGLCVKHYYAARRTGGLPMPPCSIAGCCRQSYCRGWCNTHYRRWANHGDPLVSKKSANGACNGAVCAVPECGGIGRHMIGGVVYCSIHGDRARRHGDPNKRLRVGNGEATPERKAELAAERQRRYLKTPHGKMRASFNRAKSRAVRYGCDWETGIPKEVFTELYSRSHCDICGFFMPEGDRTIDHIVALSNGGPNAPANLQVAHGVCNRKKGGANRPPPVCFRPAADDLS